MTTTKRGTSSRGRRLATVTSIVEFRAKLQRAAGDSLDVVSGSLGNDVWPLGDSSPADIQRSSNVHRLFEVGDDVTFEHGSMLTIVPIAKQPCLAAEPVTLVSMNWQDCNNLGERLQWAMDKAGVTRADLAAACNVSTVAVGKWINNDSKNLRMENLFTAADLCLVSAKWLGTGAGNPGSGISAIYADVSGPDLQIAKDMTKLDDKNLRNMVRDLITARIGTAATTKPSAHKKRAKTIG